MRGTFVRFLAMIVVTIALGSGALYAASGDKKDLAKHFEGKTVRIIHGSSAGGGYDLIARAMARVLPDYLPGKPARIIVEPRPGGGAFRVKSLRALIKAKPDGLTIGNVYVPWIIAELIGGGHSRYDLKDVKPLGTPLGGFPDGVYCINPAVAKSWADAEKLGRPIKWGGTSPGIAAHLIAVPWLKEVGAPVKLIWGYGGSTEMTTAFRRGEIEIAGSCTLLLYRDYKDWMKAGNAVPIFYVGKPRIDNDRALKDLGYERPPHIFEIAKKYKLTAAQTEAMEKGLALNRISRSYFVPGGVSDEMYDVWKEAFKKVVEDPRFAKALPQSYRDQVAPMYADEMAETLKGVNTLSPEALKLLKTLIQGKN